MKLISLIIFFLVSVLSYTQQNIEASRLEIIKYGTENEIASLIQSLRTENADYLDNELINLIEHTRNQKILSGVFAFFGEREKSGLEERAIRAIEERDEETNETILSSVDYLGKIKYSAARDALRELLDSQEKRFMNAAIRALGRSSSGDKNLADETAEYLIDYYENREPGDDNQRDIITSIGTTGSTKGVSFLSGIASDKDERIPLRMAALDALSRVYAGSGDSGVAEGEGLEAILACITTNDPNVRSAAVAALGPFSGDAVEKAIFDAFRDSYYRTRIAAAQASRDRKLASAVPYLKFRAERDEVPNVKDEAIRALGAIANDEAISTLEALFTERKNSDRVRIISAEMVMKNVAGKNLGRLIAELDEAKQKNQMPLYNGLLKVLGESKVEGDTREMENISRRFMQAGGIIEKLYALDMAANNNLKGLASEVKILTSDKNESLARKARRTAEKLGIQD